MERSFALSECFTRFFFIQQRGILRWALSDSESGSMDSHASLVPIYTASAIFNLVTVPPTYVPMLSTSPL